MTEFLSVSEYAQAHGKDPGNIRRLLASGRLKGQKAGNQWIISKGTPYPEDKRETSGKYRNQRKRAALNQHKELMNTLNGLVDDLRAVYGDLLDEIILYGSFARGEQTDESDVDIALFLNGKPAKNVTDAMIERTSLRELECGRVLSVIDIDAEKYRQWKDVLPFYKNIRKEGIVLWKAVA